MNFLQLCQRVRQEAGISGSGPASTANQTGEMKRVVDWTKTAWVDVQNKHNDWLWMQSTFSIPTIAATDTYTEAHAGLTDVRAWDRNSFRVQSTATDQTEMVWCEYRTFRDNFTLGAHASGKPHFFTITPAQAIQVYPVPDAVYTITGLYNREPTEFAADTDVPDISSEYHMVIVYRALMKYARYSAAT